MRLLSNVLLLALPIAIASRLLHWPDWATFAAAAIALLPLAGWIGHATEEAWAISRNLGASFFRIGLE